MKNILSMRQLASLKSFALGNSQVQISEKNNIALSTVKQALFVATKKLNAQSVTHAVYLAAKANII